MYRTYDHNSTDTVYSVHTKHDQFIPTTTLMLSGKMLELEATMATDNARFC